MKKYPKALSNVVYRASEKSYQWFNKNSIDNIRSDFVSSRITTDNGEGCIYIFFNRSGNAIYVGQTKMRLKARIKVKTSKHDSQIWWSKVHTVSFINVDNQAERLILEMLLILAAKPKENKHPCNTDIKLMSL